MSLTKENLTLGADVTRENFKPSEVDVAQHLEKCCCRSISWSGMRKIEKILRVIERAIEYKDHECISDPERELFVETLSTLCCRACVEAIPKNPMVVRLAMIVLLFHHSTKCIVRCTRASIEKRFAENSDSSNDADDADDPPPRKCMRCLNSYRRGQNVYHGLDTHHVIDDWSDRPCQLVTWRPGYGSCLDSRVLYVISDTLKRYHYKGSSFVPVCDLCLCDLILEGSLVFDLWHSLDVYLLRSKLLAKYLYPHIGGTPNFIVKSDWDWEQMPMDLEPSSKKLWIRSLDDDDYDDTSTSDEYENDLAA